MPQPDSPLDASAGFPAGLHQGQAGGTPGRSALRATLATGGSRRLGPSTRVASRQSPQGLETGGPRAKAPGAARGRHCCSVAGPAVCLFPSPEQARDPLLRPAVCLVRAGPFRVSTRRSSIRVDPSQWKMRCARRSDPDRDGKSGRRTRRNFKEATEATLNNK